MRDIDRIPRILNTLRECWETVPDWRFGQFIENLKRGIGCEDMFYIEDEDFEEILEKLFPKEYIDEVE